MARSGLTVILAGYSGLFLRAIQARGGLFLFGAPGHGGAGRGGAGGGIRRVTSALTSYLSQLAAASLCLSTAATFCAAAATRRARIRQLEPDAAPSLYNQNIQPPPPHDAHASGSWSLMRPLPYITRIYSRRRHTTLTHQAAGAKTGSVLAASQPQS